jgi:hypothetical protein
MPEQPNQDGQGDIVLTGHVATLHYSIDFGRQARYVLAPQGRSRISEEEERLASDEEIAHQIQDMYGEYLQSVISTQLATTLGPGFGLERMTIRAGSIELIALITAASVVLRDYNDFIERLRQAAENTRSLIKITLQGLPRGRGGWSTVEDFSIRGHWTPGIALSTAKERLSTATFTRPMDTSGTSPGSPWKLTQVLLTWALVSCTLLLAILISLIIQGR